MALLNAFMYQQQDFTSYRYKAHLVLDLKCGNTSVLSGSWHIPKNIKKIKNLLCTEERLSLIHILESAIVPEAFKNLRKIENLANQSNNKLVF